MKNNSRLEFQPTPKLHADLRDYIVQRAQKIHKKIENAIENPPAFAKGNYAYFQKYCEKKIDSMRGYGSLPTYDSAANWQLRCAQRDLSDLYTFALGFEDAAEPLLRSLDSQEITWEIERELGVASTNHYLRA